MVEPDDANKIMVNAGLKTTTKTTTTTTETTTPMTSTTPQAALVTNSTSVPVISTTLDPNHRFEMMKKLQRMDRESQLSRDLIKMLNNTLSDPEINDEVLKIITEMIERLPKGSSTTSTTEKTVQNSKDLVLLDNACLDINALKILPNDNVATARKKHGMFIIHQPQFTQLFIPFCPAN